MPKRSPKPIERQDPSEFAHASLQRTIAATETKLEVVPASVISQVMSQIGRKGAKKGGKTRMAMLTPEERSALGSKAVQARWDRKRKAII